MHPNPSLYARAKSFAFVLVFACTGCGGLGQSHLAEAPTKDGSDLNAPLALGATLVPRVELQLEGTPAPTLRLSSARPSVLSVEQGHLVGRARGVSAVLVTTREGIVLDFYHVWVERPTRVTLQLLNNGGQDLGEVRDGIDLLVGETVYLKPRLYFEAQELAGSTEGKWSVDSPILEILRQGLDDRRRLLALSPGKARLTFRASGVSSSLPIRVLAPPQPTTETP